MVHPVYRPFKWRRATLNNYASILFLEKSRMIFGIFSPFSDKIRKGGAFSNLNLRIIRPAPLDAVIPISWEKLFARYIQIL